MHIQPSIALHSFLRRLNSPRRQGCGPEGTRKGRTYRFGAFHLFDHFVTTLTSCVSKKYKALEGTGGYHPSTWTFSSTYCTLSLMSSILSSLLSRPSLQLFRHDRKNCKHFHHYLRDGRSAYISVIVSVIATVGVTCVRSKSSASFLAAASIATCKTFKLNVRTVSQRHNKKDTDA